MLNKLKKSNNKGFTIIEVMIVLAIAGLILLIVFLAVPALQRNARNTQRKNDAANLQSAVATYESNNSGLLPTALGNASATPTQLDLCTTGGTLSGIVAAGTACTGNTESSKLGYYGIGNVWVETATSTTFAAPTVKAPSNESATVVTTQSLIFELDQSCGAGNAGAFADRSVAIWYVTESANGNGSLQCVD